MKQSLVIGVNTLFLIPGEVGGTETFLRQTLREMARLLGDERLVLFTNTENHEVLQRDLAGFDKVSFECLGFRAMNRPVRILREQFQLPGRVKASGVHVLWSPGYTAPLLAGCPQVVSIHDMQYKAFPQDLTLAARLATDFLVRLGARRAAKVITGSRFACEEVVRHTAAGRSKIEVILDAVSGAFAEPVPVARRGEILGRLLPDGCPYLFCVAATYPHKNVETLVRAYGEVMNGIPHRLVLVGKARLGEPAVAQAIAALPDPARVTRLRGLSEPELIALYQGCAAFVFPSLYEGFGLPVLEALMAGVPVITTRCASLPEVGGEAACYVDPVDSHALAGAIRTVLTWPEAERQRRCEAGLAHAHTFTWASTARQTLAVLRRYQTSTYTIRKD